MSRTFSTDDRAVSVTVTHVLSIGITAILVTGLLIGAGNLLERQQDRATQQGLMDVGNGLLNDMSSVDRLAAGAATSEVSTVVDFPDRVAGNTYTVDLLVQDRHAVVYLNTTSPTYREPFEFANRTDVCESSASSGPVRVRYDPDSGDDGCLLVESAGGAT